MVAVVSGNPLLLPNLKGRFHFSALSKLLAVCILIDAFYQPNLNEFPISGFLRIFVMNGCCILSSVFCTNQYDYVIFFLQLLTMIDATRLTYLRENPLDPDI